MTVIIVVLVAVLSAFFYLIIWPALKGNFESSANCNNAICECSSNNCSDGWAVCHSKNKSSNTFKCPWKG